MKFNNNIIKNLHNDKNSHDTMIDKILIKYEQ